MKWIFSVLFVFIFSSTFFANNLTGREIMEKALNKTTWDYMQGKVELILINSSNQKRIRKIIMYSRKRNKDESDMLMKFIYPADVKNTAFLTIEHKNTDDDRYLYLPALRRVKRIASSGKGGNFMSSDFTYYDIGKPKLNDWKYKRLEDEKVNGYDCYKIECTPVDNSIMEDTGYKKIIRWIRKDIFVTIKSLYYDTGNREWKVLEVPEVKKIGNVWFQTDMIMKDLQTSHKSEMIFTGIEINKPVPEDFFSKRYLQRIH